MVLLDDNNNPVVIPSFTNINGDLNILKDELVFFYNNIPFELMYSAYESDIQIIIQNIQSKLIDLVNVNLN